MDTLPTLQEQSNICDAVHKLLLEENSILKRDFKDLTDTFIEKKQALLAQLSASVEKLKQFNKLPPVEGLQHSKLIKENKKKMMKIMLIEKENEAQLFQQAFEFKQKLTNLPKPFNKARSLYSNPQT